MKISQPARLLRLPALLAAGVLTLASALVSAPVTVSAAGAAPGGPGALSHFDAARKDCFGTARNATSKVWYTVAQGVLSDVYFPTLDNTNVETLRFVVTDGSTFTDLQGRDTTYTVTAPDPRALTCEVTTTAKSGRWRLVTDYLTDTRRNTVVMRNHFEALSGRPADYQLYLRFDPTINGNGGGGSGDGGGDSALTDTSTGHPVAVAYDASTTSQAANRDYAVPVYAALDSSRPFQQVSSGFAGTASDGLAQLDASHSLTATYDSALNGNVVQVAQIGAGGSRFTLALGFGSTQGTAVAAAEGSLDASWDDLWEAYTEGWANYDEGLREPPGHLAGISRSAWGQLVDAYFFNANVLKASEDKTFPGAISAGAASPWGQAVSAGDPGNLYFGSYREIFARDLYEAWSGFMADGDTATARAATNFLFQRQQLPDGSMPRNSLLNGKVAPDSFGVQLDEASYPILMADLLNMRAHDLYLNHIRPAAAFVMAHGPAFGVERWEEQSGYSPSTIAAEIAGLIAAAHLAQLNGDGAFAAICRGVADGMQRNIKNWTVTTNGPLANHPYFIRLSKTGDPNAAISYGLGNGGPTLDQRSVIDQGFLELVRLGILPATDPAILESLPVVDATIKATPSTGPGFLRYNGDGYGDRSSDGRPWAPSGQGTGHLWPVLAGERGEQQLALGDLAGALVLLQAMQSQASGVGLIPEQVWNQPDLAASPFGTDPTVASIGFVNGKPAGSASPLTWSAGAFVRLLRDLSTGTVLDRPRATFNRYVAHTQGQTPLTVTAPANNSAVSGSPVIVTGTTLPGNRVDVAATNVDHNSQTTLASTVVGPSGGFSLTVVVTGGTTVLNTVATAPNGATGHDQRSVVFDFVAGTVLLDVSDPSGDDNGPGNYAYPTAGDFHPGAFDITRFQVIDSGTSVVFRLQVRDLSPTFGSPLGAQLVDVYARNPVAAPADTSIAAAFPERNYQIAPTSAWNRLIEVQGFGQQYLDAHGATLGTISVSANQISRYITFSVPKSSLGQPGPGWVFTVVLTGQDGFSHDQARGFQPTPQGYQFGVCAAASSDPHCTFPANAVPKALDVITPAGVSQSNELDYTLHNPVVIQGVAIP